MLKLLALAFHFSADRQGAIDPYASHLLRELAKRKPSSPGVVSLTEQSGQAEPDKSNQTLPGKPALQNPEHDKKAA